MEAPRGEHCSFMCVPADFYHIVCYHAHTPRVVNSTVTIAIPHCERPRQEAGTQGQGKARTDGQTNGRRVRGEVRGEVPDCGRAFFIWGGGEPLINGHLRLFNKSAKFRDTFKMFIHLLKHKTSSPSSAAGCFFFFFFFFFLSLPFPLLVH